MDSFNRKVVMCSNKILCCVILFSIINLQAQSVDISGTVTTTFTSLPVQNATVSLVNQGVSVLTDTAGRYVFFYTSAGNSRFENSAAAVLKFSKSSLSFSLNKDEQVVRVEVYGMNGKHIQTVVNKKLLRGLYSFPLSRDKLSSQMYLVVFSVDGTTTQYRYLNIPGMNTYSLRSGAAQSAAASNGPALARLAPAVDTLMVFKAGYLRQRFPITTYTGVYDFYLDTICAMIMITVSEDSTYNPIENANVTIYDANTNAGIARAFTDGSGGCMLYVPANLSCYLKVTAQNYISSPPPGGMALPFLVGDSGSYNSSDVLLKKNKNASSYGGITGQVLSTLGAPVPGALVVAIRRSDSITLSAFSGPDGMYVLYNIPRGTYEMQACLAGWYQATPVTGVAVDSQVVTSGVNITLTANAGTSLSGRITFLASMNAEVDVTLTHVISNEAIPGLNTMTVSQNYTMNSIAPGTYVPWASYRNDGYVMDPDWIRKFGLPVLTFPVGGSAQTLNFSVTGAITIVSPTNPPDTIVPVVVTTDTPTFIWKSYPSTQEYVIAVYNGYGEVIWGGYDSLGNILHASIGSKDTSARYNFDGSAKAPLQTGSDAGFQYRWKIWADKGNQPGVQQLLSSSEDLRGLFVVNLR